MDTFLLEYGEILSILFWTLSLSVNDLYYELGLKSTKNGSFMGWNLDEGLIEVEYNTALADNDEPCIVIDYDISPRYEFDKLM